MTDCPSLWLRPKRAVARVPLSCFTDYPHFTESYEQYGFELPPVLVVRWKPIQPLLLGFDDDDYENAWDFIEDVAARMREGESIPPALVIDGELFDGRHRTWAAHSLGILKVPVVTFSRRR